MSHVIQREYPQSDPGVFCYAGDPARGTSAALRPSTGLLFTPRPLAHW